MGLILNLFNRTQRVKLNGCLSDKVCSPTSLPQGCMLSPLFMLYITLCQNTFKKYAGDTVIVSLLQGEERSHFPVTDYFVKWLEDSYLQLNTLKTKNMDIDFRKKSNAPEPTSIKGQAIE